MFLAKSVLNYSALQTITYHNSQTTVDVQPLSCKFVIQIYKYSILVYKQVYSLLLQVSVSEEVYKNLWIETQCESLILFDGVCSSLKTAC